GLDYWKEVDVHEYDSMEDLYRMYPEGTYYYIENFGTKHYTDYDFGDPDADILFVFGKETTGFPKHLLAGKEEKCLRIPMTSDVRSLNLSNTAAILIYEALRQQNFLNLT